MEDFHGRGYQPCDDKHFAVETAKKMEICVYPAVE